MAATVRVRQLPTILVLSLLLLTQLCSSHASSRFASSGRNLKANTNNNNNNNFQRNSNQNQNQIPNCNDMSSASHCSQNPKCRWCQSQALDDMCFSKSEASRLPHQVFSCS